MRKDIINYIVYNLPIYSVGEEGLSLEQITSEFNIKTGFELTQEQLADKIINYILEEEKK